MNSSKIRTAVIALKEGIRHIKAYQKNPETELLAICDTDEELLASRKQEYGVATAVADYREVLEMAEVQVVSVTTPDYFHAEQAIAALKAGKHVICEKPMTLNLEEAKQIIAAVDETGNKFLTGHPTRFTPGFMLAKKMIERGDLGELFMVESEYAHNYSHARGKDSWRVDSRRHPFIGGACHAVDLIRWIAGDIDEAFAYSNHKCLTDWPVDDATQAVFKFKNGVIGRVMCSIGLVYGYTMRSVFYGTEGTVICDNTSDHIKMVSKRNTSHNESHPGFATFPVKIDNHNVDAEVAEIVSAIKDDVPLKADVREGARTVAACVAAVESAECGKPVKVITDF